MIYRIVVWFQTHRGLPAFDSLMLELKVFTTTTGHSTCYHANSLFGSHSMRVCSPCGGFPTWLYVADISRIGNIGHQDNKLNPTPTPTAFSVGKVSPPLHYLVKGRFWMRSLGLVPRMLDKQWTATELHLVDRTGILLSAHPGSGNACSDGRPSREAQVVRTPRSCAKLVPLAKKL